MSFALIDGYDGAYRVSDSGLVESCYMRGFKGKRGDWAPLSIGQDKYGYLLTYLWDSARKCRVRIHIHKLVAIHFVSNPFGLDCVNHINGIKTDNSPSNLEWCTKEDNMRHAWRTGLCKPQKLTENDVVSILNGAENDTKTAISFGVSQVLVTKIRDGKVWRHVYEAWEGRKVA